VAGPCTPTYARLAHKVGAFSCSTANPIVNLRDPFHLTSWTQPVVEVVMIGGALLALHHALRRRRRTEDPTNLAIWLGAVLYVLILEPPLYFPEKFGLQNQVGLIFVHNVFTVQFLYDRLPLYIVAVYPAMAYLSYRLVESLGVFERNGSLIGAACVGFVHQCFYEIFDNLGPQLRWWIWNPAAKTNAPALAAVPLSSLVLFGTVGPCALTLLIRYFVAREAHKGRMAARSVAWRTVVAAALVPLGLVVGGIPSSLASIGGRHLEADEIVLWAELAVFAAAAIVAVTRAVNGAAAGRREKDGYLYLHAALYFGAFALLWGAALPSYANARQGITAQGTPIGSLPYAASCAIACIALMYLTLRADAGGIGSWRVAARAGPPGHETGGASRIRDVMRPGNREAGRGGSGEGPRA
jgi:hypothetical protein